MNLVNISPGAGSAGNSSVSGDLIFAAAVLRKDRKATAEFVARYADPLYGYLHSRLAPREDLVDDFLQEVFLTAWEHLSGFEGRSSLLTWLIGIARHKVEDHYRRVLREPLSLDDEDQEIHDEADSSFIEILDRERVQAKAWQVLESLPDKYRMVLLWRYWERRSAQQVADQTGKTAKAVERLLARAREQFKRRWNGE